MDSCAIFLYFWLLFLLSCSLYSPLICFAFSFFCFGTSHIFLISVNFVSYRPHPHCVKLAESSLLHFLACPWSSPASLLLQIIHSVSHVLPEAVNGKQYSINLFLLDWPQEGCFHQEAPLFSQKMPDALIESPRIHTHRKQSTTFMMPCSCYSIRWLLHELLETGKMSPGEQLVAGPVLWTGLMGSTVFGFSITFPINNLPLLSSDMDQTSCEGFTCIILRNLPAHLEADIIIAPFYR